MLSRVIASWLVVLILAPFTAPFPTCDLATLFGTSPVAEDAGHGPASGALSHDAAVVNGPAVNGTGRTRWLPAFLAPALSSKTPSSSSSLQATAAVAPLVKTNTALGTVLRV